MKKKKTKIQIMSIYGDVLFEYESIDKTIITMWKYLKDGKSPYQRAIYKVGKKYKENEFDTNEFMECSYGLNVSTLAWCLRDSLGKENIELIEVEFKVSDIAAIPYWTDGKFRVKQFKVLRKITRDEGMKIMEDISGIKVRDNSNKL